MNNIITNFAQILDFAQQQNMPTSKKRGIVREYLQTKFISLLYSHKKAKKLSFVGGTSLRLLHDLPRFSEDLDFDNHGLTQEEVENLVSQVTKELAIENLKLKSTVRGKKTYFVLKFSDLLYELKITTNPKEKLKIKVDCNDHWQLETETILLNKYGLVEQVMINQLDQILQQKLTAYAERKRVQPRDMYDLIWLYGQRPKFFTAEYVQAHNLESLLASALQRYEMVGVNQAMKRRLRPFLFVEKEVEKLEIFGQILRQGLG